MVTVTNKTSSNSRKFTAWWMLYRPTWTALTTGYLWVFISFFASFKVPSSGAILGATALIAELYFKQYSPLRAFIESSKGNKRLFWTTSEDGKRLYQHRKTKRDGTITITSLITVQTKEKLGSKEPIDYLNEIAPAKHFSEEGNDWDAIMTLQYSDKYVSRAILITAISGAVLWGYGDIFFNA